jgi:hypothetical protein
MTDRAFLRLVRFDIRDGMRQYVDAHRTFATFAKLAARIERGS